MDFRTFITQQSEQIDSQLAEFLTKQKTEIKNLHPLMEDLFSLVVETNKGGKRLRALVLKLGYLLGEGKNENEIVAPMMAVEVFHAAVLAHDDIIDQSPLRRGKPSLHFALGNDHHAISQTIVLADYGFFLSQKLLLESKFENDKKLQATQIFTNTVLDTIIGEIIDIEIPFQKIPPQEKEALTIALLKTARYTITGPLQMGYVLSEGDGDLLNDLQKFGDNLGIAFQIQDDILGVFGDQEKMGKSNSSDIEEGKITLLAAHAFAQADQKQLSELKRLYGKSKLTDNEIEKVRQIFQKVGSLDFARASALKYTDSALQVIDSLKIDSKWKSFLRNLADLLMKRSN